MSAKWPTNIATDADLYVAVNSLQTTLSTSLTSGDTSVVLASATGFPTAGGVTIDNEVIFYTNISGSTLTGCTRGSDGTTAAAHSSGVPVGASIIAFHHNGLMAEIEAIETDISARFGRGASSNAIVIPTGVTFALGTSSNKAFVTAAAQATADRTFTLPDISGNGTFAFLEGTQSFTGAKTFGGNGFTWSQAGSIKNVYTITDSTNTQTFYGGFVNAATTSSFRFFANYDPISGNSIQTGQAGAGFRINTASGDGNVEFYTGTTNNGTPSLAGKFAGSGAFSAKGTNTNDSASAGQIGEYIESVVSLGNFAGTTVYGDFTSISLTAGDWEVTVIMAANANGATVTAVSCGISTTSGNSTTGLVLGSNWAQNNIGPVSGSTQSHQSIPNYRVSLSSTTTVYFKCSATFSGGTPQGGGRISARRLR